MRRNLRSSVPPLLGLWLSCSAMTSQRAPEDPAPLLKIAGDAPSVQVVLAPGATERQIRTCREALARYGLPVPDEPAVTVTVDLSNDPKSLTVTSKKKGQVLKQERPAWWLEDLCTDALATALRVWGTENGRKMPPSPEVLAAKAEEQEKANERRRRRREAQEERRSGDQQTPAADSASGPAAKKGGHDPWGNL